MADLFVNVEIPLTSDQVQSFCIHVCSSAHSDFVTCLPIDNDGISNLECVPRISFDNYEGYVEIPHGLKT